MCKIVVLSVVKENPVFGFVHCERLSPLFDLLEILFTNVNEVFTMMCLFLVLNIVKKKRRKDGC